TTHLYTLSLHDALPIFQQRLGIELHVIEYLTNRVALHDCVQNDFAGRAQADMHRVGVAEQVVQVAEDFLVRAHQKCAEDVPVARSEEHTSELQSPYDLV